MPFYFAYGANMDVEDMARRCPRSRPLGVARLMRHRLAITREGWLTATRDARGRVHGVLWDLALADVSALDRFEQLGDGLYVKTTQAVIAGSGPKRALVYFGANAGPGRADGDYIRAVIAAARHWRLPEEAIATLVGFAGMGGGGGGDAAGAPRVRPRFPTPFDR
jgi:hypothetical protein